VTQPDTIFASSSVPRHLVRGALGLPMMVAAFVLVPWWGPLALLLVVPAAVLLRGCPTCWALGLPMMVAAFVLVPWWGPLALLLVVPAAVLLRGCPTCWALGLAQTCALSPRAGAGGSRRLR
jgi:hypothetical protein